MSEQPIKTDQQRMATGIAGIDEILGGGFPAGRIYLVEGPPGTGKTTMGLQFLLDGVEKGEKTLFVTLLQTREEVAFVAESHGWSIDGIEFLELPESLQEMTETEQTVFAAEDVEVSEVTDAIVAAIAEHEPVRLVFDSLSELQALIDRPSHLRRQLIRLKRAMRALDPPCTAILTSGTTVIQSEPTVQTLVHGMMRLEQESVEYGLPRRYVEIEKVRGVKFAGGEHDMVIQTGGILVYPPLKVPDERRANRKVISSGNENLDNLFGGGLPEGSSCVVMGTSGAGKSTLASHFATAVAEDGGCVSVYCFDESVETYQRRSRGLDMGVCEHVDDGRIALHGFEPTVYHAGQLFNQVRRDVLERDVRMVIIDSFTGWMNLVAAERALTTRLHHLLKYLSDHNVSTMFTVNVHGVFDLSDQPIDASYLSDTVVVMRHFEAMGRMRRCVAVMKKRHGDHERTIREIEFSKGGLRVGPPLENFSGVLTGTPTYHGDRTELLELRETDHDQ